MTPYEKGRIEVEDAPFAAVADEARKFYATMFHPEVVHTEHGGDLLRAFTHRIAGCTGDWTMAEFRRQAVARIRAQVGKGKVICGLSGGVDSAVTAVLIHEAIGEQLTCIFVDNGMMRAQEPERVVSTFRGQMAMQLLHVDAVDRFLGELVEMTNPETKRKRIGETFIHLFEDETKALGRVDFLVQGPTYPDVIESVAVVGQSAVIKSHHNVGGLPERMRMQLIEPLRELFKDEVRAVGRELGLPEVIVGRQPFPGPGLAIRVLGEVTEERLAVLKKVHEACKAHLEASAVAISDEMGAPITLACEEIFTMAPPPPWAIIWRAAAWLQNITLFRLASTMR